MEERNVATEAIIVFILNSWSNLELAAFKNAIQTVGHIPPTSISFAQALDCNLIDNTGRVQALGSARTAAAYEVNRRVTEGTWT